MIDIIRAWKDPEYRSSLSEAELALLPQHPAGQIELSDAELEVAARAGPITMLITVHEVDSRLGAVVQPR